MALLQLPEKLLYPLGPRGGKVWLKPGAGLEYYRFAYLSASGTERVEQLLR